MAKKQKTEVRSIIYTVKRIAGLILLSMTMLLLPLSANALEQLQSFVPLSNKSIIAVLQNSGYENWYFYQPSSRETDTDTSSSSYLDPLSTYPIIAFNGNNTCLIVLKKIDNQWMVSSATSQAITRDRFILTGFSIDEHYSEIERIQYVFFDFEDENGELLTLNLQLSDIYPSCFASIHRKNMDLILNYDRGITLQFDFPFLSRCSYEVYPKQYISFKVDEFSFAECPIAIQDFLVPASISSQREGAGLFTFPDDSMEPVLQLSKDENIDVFYQPRMTDWVLVYYKDNLLFAHGDDISLYDNN